MLRLVPDPLPTPTPGSCPVPCSEQLSWGREGSPGRLQPSSCVLLEITFSGHPSIQTFLKVLPPTHIPRCSRLLLAVFLPIFTRVQAILSTWDNPLLPPTTQITHKLSDLPRPRCSPRCVPLVTYTKPPCGGSRHTDSKAPHTHDFLCWPRVRKGCFSSNAPGI